MEVINFDTQLAALKNYWEAQSIYSTAKPIAEISFFSFGDNFSLPTQFVKYFSVTNGMESLYPRLIRRTEMLCPEKLQSGKS
ncbi:MAG TPA: hypothetical protein VHC48_03350 [Puia sp.]|nr:hypothetical protein [Puia sp.]